MSWGGTENWSDDEGDSAQPFVLNTSGGRGFNRGFAQQQTSGFVRHGYPVQTTPVDNVPLQRPGGNPRPAFGRGRGFNQAAQREDSDWFDGGGPSAPSGSDSESESVIYVERRLLGRIIGPRGATIREIQDKTGSHINIKKEEENANGVPVFLEGSSDQCQSARKEIENIISQNSGQSGGFGSSQSRGFDGGNRSKGNVVVVPRGKVGRVIGKGGSKIRDLQDTTGCRIKIKREEETADGTPIQLEGEDSQCCHARQLIEELTEMNSGPAESYAGKSSFGDNAESSNWRSSTNDSQSNGFGGGAQRTGFGGQGGRERGGVSGSRRDTSEILVPFGKLGMIIGKGGSKIRQMQDESGCKIILNKDNEGGLEVPICLQGSEEARKKAEELIEELIVDKLSIFSGGELPPELATPKPKPAIDWANLNARKAEFEAERWAEFPEVIKNFYIEDPEVANMLPNEVKGIRKENNNITVDDLLEGDERLVPNPVVTFEQAFKHYPEIMREIEKAGFKVPSPIQKQAWPIILQGMDLIGIAQTGTGKTLAFLLPAFLHIEGQPTPRSERTGPTVLALSPTRELALQIKAETEKYSYKGISCLCVYGGGNRREQIAAVRKGVEIVVATPGRLNDLINAGVLDITSVSYLILDEADRMLDMGFEPEIRKVLLDIRPDRQTIMTSATWPEGVRRLARSYMKDPMMVFVGSLDLAAVHTVRQQIEIVDEEDKRARLYDFLRYEFSPTDKVLVFVGRKSTADDVTSDMMLEGIEVQSIHGDREQSDREQALQDLKDGTVRILIATDVASRGLDISDITHVFNYDFPRNMEEYVHRIGRTGRAGRSGASISLLTRQDWNKAKELISIMEEANQPVPDELYKMAERYNSMRERRREEGPRDSGRGQSRYGGGGFGGGGGRRGGGGGRRRDKNEGVFTAAYGIA